MRTQNQIVRPADAANLFGNLGPQCPACSGLGHVLRLGAAGAPTRYTAKCVCGGTGVDREAMQAREMSSLLKRMSTLETANLLLSKQNKEIISRYTKNGKASRQFWAEYIAWATASGTAVNTSTAETILFPNVTIPANYMQDGRCLVLRVQGVYGTHSAGTVTMQFFLRWGGVTGSLITKTGVFVLATSLTTCLFNMEIEIQTRSNGSAGTLMANGTARVFGATAPTIASATGAPAVGPFTNGGQNVPATASCDLTADTALAVSVQHGANNAANTATGLQYTLLSCN